MQARLVSVLYGCWEGGGPEQRIGNSSARSVFQVTRSLTFLCSSLSMLEGNSRLGSAQVTWNDYVGTAAADDAQVLFNTRSLYEIAGLNRDEWSIVGLDFAMGSAERVVLYAAARTEVEPADAAAVSVTAFHLPGSVQLDQFLREVFNRLSVRLLSSAVSDKQLLVSEVAELQNATDH